MKTASKNLCVLLWLMCTWLPARSITISGPSSVCVGSGATYTSTTVTGAVKYFWTVTHGRIYGSSTTASVTWDSIGSGIINIEAINAVGTVIASTTDTVKVYGYSKPFITTDFRVACQSFDTLSRFDYRPVPVLSDSNGCVDVCEHRLTTYLANGFAASDNLKWLVTGGSIIGSSMGSAIQVKWDSAGVGGFITLTDSNIGGCISLDSICINIISRPHASFTINGLVVSMDTVNVCLSSKVLFNDASTEDSNSSITNFQWAFGDGGISAQKSPVHIYNVSKYYPVKLVVTNACGCTDTSQTVVAVKSTKGPKIICPSIVCQGDTVVYKTNDTCSGATYNWIVSTGGVILTSIPYPDSIVVAWDSAGPSGYGIVSLSDSGCSGTCTQVTSVQIPVIQSDPQITGLQYPNQLLCSGRPYQFSIPLWPGTRYNWGVEDDSAAVISGRNSNVVALQFNTPAFYTVHVWYQNSLKLCGGDLKFVVQAAPAPTIGGKDIVCLGALSSYKLINSSGTIPGGYWHLLAPDGSTTDSHSLNFATTFTLPGVYSLSVHDSLTCIPVTKYITVVDSGITPDSVSGVQNVCAGRSYEYKAYHKKEGYRFVWTIFNGTSIVNTGDSIMVKWTGGAPTLEVSEQSIDTPFCTGNIYSYFVNLKSNTATIFGDTSVCANGIKTYSDSIFDADATTWKVIPDSLGSAVSGYDSGSVKILWNNVISTRAAKLVVHVEQCSTDILDTIPISVKPTPTVAITDSLSSLCNQSTEKFTASAGANQYNWNFGDGTTASVSGGVNTVLHQYTLPPGVSSTAIKVSVSTSGISGAGCGVTGSSWNTVTILPGPYATIYTPNRRHWCTGSAIADTLHSAKKNVSGTPRYKWFRNGVAYRTGSDTLITSDTGTFYLVISGSGSSCSYTSNSIYIGKNACPTCADSVYTKVATSCGVIYDTGYDVGATGSNPSWLAPGGTIVSSGKTAAISYTKPGYYEITYSEAFGAPASCTATEIKVDSVPLVSNFYAGWGCGSTLDTLKLYDNSFTLATWLISNYSWNIKNSSGTTIATSMQSDTSLALSAGVYTITETVLAQAIGGSATQSCIQSKTITVPAVPSSFVIKDSLGTSCEGIPIYFRYTISPTGTAGIANNFWSFGDKASSLIINPQRTYTWKAPSFPNIDTVSLMITDTLGCTYTSILTDTIFENNFNGTILGTDTTLCPGVITVLQYNAFLGTTTPTIYRWSDGNATSTDSVSQTGSYTVRVSDNNGCYFIAAPAVNIGVINPIPIQITGRQSYCPGEAVYLTANEGRDYYFIWYRNDTLISISTYRSLLDNGLNTGRYIYTLRDSFSYWGCAVSSGNDTVVIHGLPSKPAISGLSYINCSNYELQLTTDSVSGYTGYNWSNGVQGIKDTIFTGGSYRLWVTDSAGCTNYVDTTVPYSAESWLAWFPTGCYLLCNQTIPEDSVYGPPASFASWDWQLGGSADGSGTNSIPAPLPLAIPGGNYQLELNNGLCTNISDTMSLQYEDCSCTNIVQSATLGCDGSNPSGYILNVTFTAAAPATVVTLGIDVGPVVPFKLAITPSGAYTLQFTTLKNPPPSSVLLSISYLNSLGRLCFDTNRITTVPYPCSWVSEKQSPGNTEKASAQSETGLVVYPNPASSQININYVFGQACNCSRRIGIYDITGHMLISRAVYDASNTLDLQTGNLDAGIYIVRMEEDGRSIETARFVKR